MKVVYTFFEATDSKVSIMLDDNNMLCVMCEDSEGLTDFPVRYQDGKIAYDHPERYSSFLKQQVKEAFLEIDRRKRNHVQTIMIYQTSIDGLYKIHVTRVSGSSLDKTFKSYHYDYLVTTNKAQRYADMLLNSETIQINPVVSFSGITLIYSKK